MDGSNHPASEKGSMMSRFVWMLMLASLLAVLGCEQKPADRTPDKVTSEDVRRDANQAAETAVEFSQQTKEEFQKKLDAQLKQADAEIARLREEGSELKDEAKVDWERKMANLETKRDAARAKLAEVGASSAEAWKDVQKGAQSAWDELDQAFRDASQEF
jgi:LPS O-antigen subunit length determinant protein (WzzB/FepE family)